MSDTCRNCVHFNGGHCSKLKEEFEFSTNVNQLFEGYTKELLEENLKEIMIKKIKSVKKRTVSDSEVEEIVDEMLEDLDESLYEFMLKNLEVSAKTTYYTEFKCNHWR